MRRHISIYAMAITFGFMADTELSWTQEIQTEELIVTATRLNDHVVGTSVSIIDEISISDSPAEDLPNLIGLVPGVYNRDLFSGTNGAQATVDIRGFGAVGTQNSLILVDGRRLNDVDLAAVDLANIPLDGIARIEVIRGNAGSVLYGDGAVGGAINIITKSPSKQKDSIRFEYAYGQEQKHETNLATNQSFGRYAINFSSNYIHGEGFRDNNDIIQRNAIGQLRFSGDSGETFVKLGLDFQSIGLPGSRQINRATGSDLFVTARNEATSLVDKALQSGIQVTVGTTKRLTNGSELILDAGVRRKDQDSRLFSTVDTVLTTWSITPRANFDLNISSFSHRTTIGSDLYYTYYDSDRRQDPGDRPFHEFRANQTTFGLYGQDEIGLTDNLVLSTGLRFTWVKFSAGDEIDNGAPGGGFETDHDTTRDLDQKYVYNLGLDYHILPEISAFTRTSRGIRFPTIDERIASSDTNTFKLKTQTSRDLEGGFRYNSGGLSIQGSVFVMKLKNEIRFDPVLGGGFGLNENTDPTKRTGGELITSYHHSPTLNIQMQTTYVKAVFDEGVFSGNLIPLVPQWQFGAKLNWNILREKLGATLTTKYVDQSRMENDESNEGEQIPAYYLVDLKLRGSLAQGKHGQLNWSFIVNNLFDENYYNFAVRSTTTATTFNVNPLAGRSVLFRLGWKI